MFRSVLFWCAYTIGLDPRGLFVYWDGRHWRRADPMRLARRLWSIDGFESDESRKLIDSDAGITKLKGFAEIANAVRIAFEIKEVESGGLTDLESEGLLTQFEAYLGDLKKMAALVRPRRHLWFRRRPRMESRMSSWTLAQYRSTTTKACEARRIGCRSPGHPHGTDVYCHT